MCADNDHAVLQYSPHALLGAAGERCLVVETPFSETRLALPADIDSRAFLRELDSAVKSREGRAALASRCNAGFLQTVDWLVKRGFLDRGNTDTSDAQGGGWHALFRSYCGGRRTEGATAWGFPRDEREAMERVRASAVHVYGSGCTAARIEWLLNGIGCRQVTNSHDRLAAAGGIPAGTDIALFAGVPDDALSAHAFNARCIDDEVPWIGIYLHPNRVDVGPLHVPRESACIRCAGAGPGVGFDIQYVENPETRLPTAVPGAGIAVMEACRFLAGLEANTYSRIWRWKLASYDVEWLDVYKNPACPSCGVHEDSGQARRP